MKVIQKEKEKFVFLLEQQEQPLFLALLDCYPLIPPAYQPLSKSLPARQNEANQQLLDEALAEQRLENKRQLQEWLKETHHFEKAEAGWLMTLSTLDLEWLLQVLNDIRVGSWILLGSPEKDLWDFELNDQTAPHAWAMEMAGSFQAHLLEALRDGGT